MKTTPMVKINVICLKYLTQTNFIVLGSPNTSK